MIQHYTDHAANERTYLAWVRTAIAVMAFGFVVERFDVFLKLARASMAPHGRWLSSTLGEAAGIGLMAAGMVMVILATIRFLRTRSEIDDPAPRLGEGSRLDLALAAMLLLLGGALMTYLVANLIGRG
jgi:putative membrane protein